MKKFSAILLLTCLMVPFLSTFFYLSMEKRNLKKQVKRYIIDGVDESSLVFMKFSLKDSQKNLNWEHSKEFEFKGEMYDVVKKRIEGDSVSYWLWWDHDETALNLKLKKALAGIWENNEEKEQNKSRLHEFSKTLFFENPSSPSYGYSIFKDISLVRYCLAYRSISLSFPPPPPKSIS